MLCGINPNKEITVLNIQSFANTYLELIDLISESVERVILPEKTLINIKESENNEVTVHLDDITGDINIIDAIGRDFRLKNNGYPFDMSFDTLNTIKNIEDIKVHLLENIKESEFYTDNDTDTNLRSFNNTLIQTLPFQINFDAQSGHYYCLTNPENFHHLEAHDCIEEPDFEDHYIFFESGNLDECILETLNYYKNLIFGLFEEYTEDYLDSNIYSKVNFDSYIYKFNSDYILSIKGFEDVIGDDIDMLIFEIESRIETIENMAVEKNIEYQIYNNEYNIQNNSDLLIYVEEVKLNTERLDSFVEFEKFVLNF